MLLKQVSKIKEGYHFSLPALLVLSIIILGVAACLAIGFYSCTLYYSLPLGVSLLFMLTASLIYLLKKLTWFWYCYFKRKPGLTITDTSLMDNINKVNLPWSDTRSIIYKLGPSSITGLLYIKTESKDHLAATAIDLRKEYRISPYLLKGRNKDIVHSITKVFWDTKAKQHIV